MSDGLAAIIWGLITFSILIVIHEGGHFAAARIFGVKVHEFMIGLPGPALRIRGKKTTYGITAIPLGGYVRIAGMDPGPEDPQLAPVLASVTRLGTANAAQVSLDTGIGEEEADALLVTLADWDALEQLEGDEFSYRSRFAADDASDETALLDRARAVTYRALSTPKRLIVLSSGVVMNLLTAVLVFTVVLTSFGFFKASMRVEEVAKGSAAEKAGILPGDRIISVDGVRVRHWTQLVMTVSEYEPGDTVTVAVERAGERKDVEATLGKAPKENRPILGITEAYVEVPAGRPWAAFLESFGYIGLVFSVIAGLFNPQTFTATVSQSSSVIGASYMAADAARSSALDYAGLIAMLSVSLGVINVFPIPPLDGGKMAVELVERFRGRPLSREFSLGLSVSGAVLLFSLIFYLMYADIVKFIIK